MSRNHVAKSQPVEILLVTSALEKYKDVPFKDNKALPNLNHRKAPLKNTGLLKQVGRY